VAGFIAAGIGRDQIQEFFCILVSLNDQAVFKKKLVGVGCVLKRAKLHCFALLNN